ncbi:hypothetical protein [Agrococcus jenensis]|uniref:Uncharacterized protein n=1 Tax=Agrococcus jenensis TaxID=46353 RepID=A0A3N2ARY1_9MICO|nr:hypothetical protein [Agrococcus jenensis]ROR65809.1 hypothetical protein EDD26_1179 [Agrococcus jenensis]
MKHLPAIAAAALAAATVLGVAAPANAAQPSAAAMNSEAYWESLGYGECTKYELPDGADIVWLPATAPSQQFSLLVLKAGSGAMANDVIPYPYDDGYAYLHSSGKDISHYISCLAPRLS